MVHVAQVVPDNKKFSSERLNRKRKVEPETYQAPVVTPPKTKKQRTVLTKKSPMKSTQMTPKIVCICKKQYDPSKFVFLLHFTSKRNIHTLSGLFTFFPPHLFYRLMVGCDTCAKWFHPECVSLNETQVQSMEKFMCPDCAPDAGEELYCLCKQPYDESQ